MEKATHTYKSLLEWILLWIFGSFVIGIRNDLKLMGKLSSLEEIIIAQLYLGLMVVPLALIVWFIMKFVLRRYGKVKIIEGKHALRNTFLIWLVVFGFIFIRGF